MPPDVPTFLTPPEAGRILRIKADRVITLIRSGEIKASNVATKLSGRPRYRIAASDLEAWLNLRAAAAVTTPTPRRRRKQADRPAGWISYFGMDGK